MPTNSATKTSSYLFIYDLFEILKHSLQNPKQILRVQLVLELTFCSSYLTRALAFTLCFWWCFLEGSGMMLVDSFVKLSMRAWKSKSSCVRAWNKVHSKKMTYRLVRVTPPYKRVIVMNRSIYKCVPSKNHYITLQIQ